MNGGMASLGVLTSKGKNGTVEEMKVIDLFPPDMT